MVSIFLFFLICQVVSLRDFIVVGCNIRCVVINSIFFFYGMSHGPLFACFVSWRKRKNKESVAGFCPFGNVNCSYNSLISLQFYFLKEIPFAAYRVSSLISFATNQGFKSSDKRPASSFFIAPDYILPFIFQRNINMVVKRAYNTAQRDVIFVIV